LKKRGKEAGGGSRFEGSVGECSNEGGVANKKEDNHAAAGPSGTPAIKSKRGIGTQNFYRSSSNRL